MSVRNIVMFWSIAISFFFAVGSIHKLGSFLEMKKFGSIRSSMLNLQPASFS